MVYGSKSKIAPVVKKQHMLVLAIAISLLLAIGGYSYYSFEKKSITKSKYEEIETVAKMKIGQITQWRNERIADAKVIAQSTFLAQRIKLWLNDKNNTSLEREIIDHLTLAKVEYRYAKVYLASTKGEFLLAINPHDNKLNPFLSKKIVEAIKNQRLTFTDLYYCSIHNKIHYDIIEPILDSKRILIAALVFRTDPDDYLYPLIKSWPIPCKTAETLLIKKDGDSVLYLNELRMQKNTAFNLRIPLNRIETPAVHAVYGYRGIFEGIDYRGIKVLAYIEPIPDTPWFMVSKIDKSEVYSELRFRELTIGIFTFTLILLLVVGINLIYKVRQKNTYKELLLKEKELWENQEEFKTTLYSIGDGVIATDNNGMIRQMNPVAEQLTGWEEANAKGKPLDEVFVIVNEDSRTKVENPAHKVIKEGMIVGLANHTLLISKNGKEVPIADSGAPIRSESGETIGVILVFRDQTEERATQLAIASSETRYRRLFESAKDGILILDANSGRIVDVNPFLEEMLGYSHDEFCKKKIWEIGSLKNSLLSRVAFQELQEKEYIRYEDLPLSTANGKYVEVEFVSNVYLVDSIKVIQCNIRDITQRKLAEKSLKESESNFRNLFENSTVGMSMTRVDGSIQVNRAFCNMLGYPEDELKAKKWMDVTHDEDIQLTSDMIQLLLDGKQSVIQFEKRYIHKNGSTVWTNISSYLQRDKDEKPKFFITSIIDITERKKALEDLKKLSSRNEAILSSVPDIIMEVDNSKVYTWANRSGVNFFGKDVIGKEASFFFEGEQETYSLVQPLFNGTTENIMYVESWQRRHDGEKRLLAWWCRALKDEKGNVTGALSAAQDITERKHVEEALKHKIDELEQFNSMAVGRELKMIELKEEINLLLKRLGENEKYQIID